MMRAMRQNMMRAMRQNIMRAMRQKIMRAMRQKIMRAMRQKIRNKKEGSVTYVNLYYLKSCSLDNTEIRCILYKGTNEKLINYI